MGIETVLDLLTHYPRRYVDRRNAAEIGSLEEGEEAMVTGTVVRSSSRRLRGGRTMTEVVIEDGSGRLKCTFFNQAWRSKQLTAGTFVTVFGRLDLYRGARQMSHPVVDLAGDQTGRIVAVYPQSQKARIDSVELGIYVEEALRRAGDFAEPVPGRHLRALGLVGRTAAFRGIHVPESDAERFAARRRLAFDELLRLQLLLVARKRRLALEARGISHVLRPGGLVERFVAGLPFELTGAQKRALSEIEGDLTAPHPMNRLLQGDVGSGKTVVALATLLAGIEGGHQGALMVPTEVLAEQHFISASRLLEGLEVPDDSRLGGKRPLVVGLLTSRISGAERARLLAELAAGGLDLLVGTHALLTEQVTFRSLGVVVVDEQHRFGVEQRALLREKGARDPDLLIMTATPIPRSAAMTVYGDLDHTVLDELPPGRTPIQTRWLEWAKEAAVWKHVRNDLDAGRQAYVVCPLVEGSLEEGEEGEWDVEAEDEDSDVGGSAESGRLRPLPGLVPSDAPGERRPPRSVNDESERLASGALSSYRVGMLHGQMPAKEKDAVMGAFRRGELQVLVATTVVEVGVDVANATVMVIEDADRFGIAQLHQLRGRVGRGTAASRCFLLADPITTLSEKRLEAVVRSENGFELAEADLELRGGGTMLGARQKGRTDLKLARLSSDRDLVMQAREVATAIIDADPGLQLPEHEVLSDELGLFSEEEREFLFRS
jgi:ATP-dependent DNA helicase RecG